MSNFLGQVSQGAPPDGQRIVIAAVEKVGKTTLVANAPRALLIPMEMGFASVKTPIAPMITRFDDLISLLDEVKGSIVAGKFPYKTLAFDSATALEQLIHNKVIETDPDVIKKTAKNVTMETAHGGYGKAYQLANSYFAQFTRYCDDLAINGKVNIAITCHVFPSLVKDAAYGEYNSWDLLLHSPKNDKTYGKREMMTQWVDMIGFLHEPLFVVKNENNKSTFSKGVSANQGRVLAVDRTPGWVAGNRYGLQGVIPIPKENGWNALAHAIYVNTGIDVYNRDV
jgi:hypothetical protein